MKFLESVSNFLLGLIAIIFTYTIRLLFLISSFIALGAIGYTMLMLLTSMHSGEVGSYSQCLITISLFSVCYLYITNLMGVGMADIIKSMNLVLHHVNKSESNKNPRMGEKGVFKR